MSDVVILRLKCGMQGCLWALPVDEPMTFSPASLTELYGRFRQHCADQHGLNPETNELPNADQTSFVLDTSRGGQVQVVMDAVIDKVEFANSFDFEPFDDIDGEN